MPRTVRGILASATGILVVAALAGCSGASSALPAPTNSGASNVFAIGQAAASGSPVASSTPSATAGPTPSATPTSGGSASSAAWTDTTGCPAELISGEKSILGPTVKFTVLDASTTFGVRSDSQLNPGMHPSCAFSLVTSAKSEIEEVFIGMPRSYLDTFAKRMESDGFTLDTAISSSNIDAMTKGSLQDPLSYFPKSSQAPFSYVVAIG